MRVELDQYVGGDRAGDQRIGVEGGDALRIMGEEFRLDVGIDEEAALELLPERDALLGEGHIELDREGRRGEHQRADVGRVVMHPGSGEHRPEGLRDECQIALAESVTRDLAHEAVDVAHKGGEGRRVAALACRAPVAARVPGIEGVARHGELVDQMRHAAAMLVAAMEEKDGALGLVTHRRPVAIEDLGAVMGPEGPLLGHPFDARGCCRGDILLMDHGVAPEVGHCSTAPLRPLRIRLMAVASDSVASAGNMKGVSAAGHRPKATRKPMTPSASARSLLPKGPA